MSHGWQVGHPKRIRPSETVFSLTLSLISSSFFFASFPSFPTFHSSLLFPPLFWNLTSTKFSQWRILHLSALSSILVQCVVVVI